MNCSEVIPTNITVDQFWQCINILISKPHIVNNKLWGCKMLLTTTCKPLIKKWNSVMSCGTLKYINTDSLHCISHLLDELHLENIHDSYELQMHTKYVQVILTKLLPKRYTDENAFQLACLNYENNEVIFHDVTPDEIKQHISPNFSYTLQLNDKTLILTTAAGVNTKTRQWIIDNVLVRLNKWSTDKNKGFCVESLSFVGHDKYYNKYNELKSKYGKEMVKIWPECTDPSKFVYEDIAIATYLLLIWEEERLLHNIQDFQTFVDLGCGNGLLVYILTKEGHKGVGIDVRKRHIWDMYSSDVILKEKTIMPSDSHLYPNTDWVIGNHSDELTPWIPVIAAKSSYNCNFFLLPCCAYNFDGSKYQRKNSSISQYTEYLEYIKKLCEDCGFRTCIDRLKIPSTKRTCFITKGRIYSKEDYNSYNDNIKNVIDKFNSKVNDNEIWVTDFKPRDPLEKVKNCTQIDKMSIKSIVDCITKYLLEDYNLHLDWSTGKTVKIRELIKLLSREQLNVLKSECGGLQTLIKNNHHIFKVFGGKVQLRYPRTVEEVIKSNTTASNIKVKVRPCWFYDNHPQGCPLSDPICSFIHTKV